MRIDLSEMINFAMFCVKGVTADEFPVRWLCGFIELCGVIAYSTV